jgi:acyl transferase domain-containing protein
LFLESAWEALENAGYDSERYPELIGVYAGVGINSYLFNLYLSPDFKESMVGFRVVIGNAHDHLTTRVSYKLNLRGPSVNLQTACSTSLVAVHLACQSLINGDCDIALAGGVSLTIPQKIGYLYEEGGIGSPDGHCRAYDISADGTLNGSGVGIVVLKRLADAQTDGDYIHAVIKGSAINNDGSMKVGYMAPSVDGQAEVIGDALAVAGVEPETITYVEGHGTGTALGDPIEIAALTQAYRSSTDKKQFCAIGSVKTNVGHLDTAAGVAGLIKTVLALEHKQIPPSLHFKTPNPKIDFANSPFYVNTELSSWKQGNSPRRAGVSSFGVGGTNAHIILEEAPAIEPSSGSRPWQLLILSAKTISALEKMTANLASYLKKRPDLNLADAAYTLQLGRRSFNHRRILVCEGVEQAAAALEALDSGQVITQYREPRERAVAFMFSGQGAQYVNMARELYLNEETFRKQVDRCAQSLISHLGLDLRDIIYPPADQTEQAERRLNQTAITQPALFVIEYSLAKLWISWGVRPQAMVGHSIGEYVAACLAGVFSLEDALALVAARGQLMQQLPGGTMLSLPLSEQEVQKYLNSDVSLAAVNSPTQCVVSGPRKAMEELEKRLSAEKIACRRLLTSHAFHSQMMDPIFGHFAERMRKVDLRPPEIPYLSNITGAWITEAEATDPIYWARHLRDTVRFSDDIAVFLKDPRWALLEVGPGRTLSTFVQQHREKNVEQLSLCSLRHPHEQDSDLRFALRTLGRLWLAGIDPSWSGFLAEEQRRRLPLPTYPFERQRYWVEPKKPRSDGESRSRNGHSTESASHLDSDHAKTGSVHLHPRANIAVPYVAPGSELEQTIARIWEELLGMEQIGTQDNFFELGGDSLMATQIVSRLRDAFQMELPMRIFFEKQTVAELALEIEERLVKEIAELSEEEAHQLLN